MQTTLCAAIESYLRMHPRSRGTRNEYQSTLRKWEQWGRGGHIEDLQRKDIRDFLDWVHQRALEDQGTTPGRTANKAREHLRAVFSWAWEQELIESPPRFPKPRPQRDVAGRHYLSKTELNALYFATYQLPRPRGWDSPMPIGRYWRAALVLFFNYGLDTGTVWKSIPWHEPIRWRNVCWGRHAPDREIKEQCPWGWLFYRRIKTSKTFYRPLNRVVHAHLQSIRPETPSQEEVVFLGGAARPNARFQRLCTLAGIGPRTNVDTGRNDPWELKDLRKTCATYYDEHMPESSVEILGHSVGGITYRRPGLRFVVVGPGTAEELALPGDDSVADSYWSMARFAAGYFGCFAIAAVSA